VALILCSSGGESWSPGRIGCGAPGGRLELASPDTVALRCRHLEINTAEGTDLLSGGDVYITGQEMRVKTESDIHMNGRIIHLNC